jgi:hypothetical protein
MVVEAPDAWLSPTRVAAMTAGTPSRAELETGDLGALRGLLRRSFLAPAPVQCL